jgi:hypothetical protein
LKVRVVDGFRLAAALPSPWAVAGANSGRNRQGLDWPMIQVGAACPGRFPNGATIERRDRIETGSANLFAEVLTSPTKAARIVVYDWNRNSQAMRLKSSTLYIACHLADVAVEDSTKVRRFLLVSRIRSSHTRAANALANFGFKGTLARIAYQCGFGSEVRFRPRRQVWRTSEPPHWREFFQQHVVAGKTVLLRQATVNARNCRSMSRERQSRSPMAPSRRMPDRSTA